MALLYTTEDSIMRRLTGRLEQFVPSAMGRVAIDPDLLNQVATQAEDRLNMVLAELYQLPLSKSYPILAEYVELRCVCSIIPVYFQRQNVSDDRGLGELACKEASQLLDAIASGKFQLRDETKLPDKLPNINLNDAPTLVVQRGPAPTHYAPEQERIINRVITNAEELRF